MYERATHAKSIVLCGLVLGMLLVSAPDAQARGAGDATITRVWVVHNQFQGFQKGMAIHVDFTIDNRRGSTCELNAYFSYGNGLKLRDFNGYYTSVDSQVSVSQRFTPRYTSTVFTDVVLFLPYDELHMEAGFHDLKFNLQIQDAWGNLLAASNGHHFSYSNPLF